MPDLDTRVRAAAFAWLDRQRQLHGEILPRTALAEGFEFEGRRVPLLGPRGHLQAGRPPDNPTEHHVGAAQPTEAARYR